MKDNDFSVTQLIIRDITEYEPDDNPEALHISVKALELVLTQHIEPLQKRLAAAEADCIQGGQAFLRKIADCANLELRESQARTLLERMHDGEISIGAFHDALGELLDSPEKNAFACWSCKKPVTMSERAEADGNCPHCDVELDIEEWPFSSGAPSAKPQGEPVAWLGSGVPFARQQDAIEYASYKDKQVTPLYTEQSALESAASGERDTEKAHLAALLESLAKEVYQSWESQPGFLPWVDGGNSSKQEEARQIASRTFELALSNYVEN